MSDHERSGKRDLAYNNWHRQDSIRHCLDNSDGLANEHAAMLKAFDVDFVELNQDGRALAFIELTRKKSERKPCNYLRKMAQEHGRAFCFVIYYKEERGELVGNLLVDQVIPRTDDTGIPRPVSLKWWARFLLSLRLDFDSEWEKRGGNKE